MKQRLLTILILSFVFMAPVLAQQGMSDQQVMEYVKSAMQQGKDQKAIAMELARRGVTKEQAVRVKNAYEKQNAVTGTTAEGETTRARVRGAEDNDIDSKFNFTKETENVSAIDMNGDVVDRKDDVYGRNIFNTKNLSFEPSMNLATPANYRLGPGDEVIIDIWGTNQTTIRQTISPDGNINIGDIGLVNLNGMSIEGATKYLRKVLNKIYTGIDDPNNPASQMKVTLGNARTIQVNIMGEVVQPGTYSLSSFSTVFHALYKAGGVSGIGSLRNINVVRHGHKVATVDVYDFILKGLTADDIRLQEGDVIMVPPYEALVKIEGNVKRPMKYETTKNETLKTLLKYAGGFQDDAYTRSLRVVRQNGKEYEINTVDEIDYSVYKLKNGDVVTIEPILDRFENKIEVKGAVYRPGIYQYGGTLNTVRELVKKADGLMPDAFSGRAVLQRQREDFTREVLAIDIKGIMNGTKPDVMLQRYDVLFIPSIHDIEELGNISITGEIMQPGSYPYADNMTLEDLIVQSGGLKESASTVRVDVARRIKDSKSTVVTPMTAQLFSFALKDGFVVDGEQGFVLQPYDEVYVRRSPGYSEQKKVSVRGEVLYDGAYVLTLKNERLSSLVKRAGGVNPYAYVRGAKLMRVANADEIKRMQAVYELMAREKNQLSLDSLKLNMDSIYSVGIDLEKAIASPGSSYDIVLREGDRLIVPVMDNTIKINGAVMMPNTVTYSNGKSLKYYISQAGGYSNQARKSRAFIVYMNGQVAKVKGSGRGQIEPGCEIIVPTKEKKNGMGLAGILGIASSIGSLGLTAASVANILK